MDPLISIVIPVYNGADYMKDAINSALAQTYSNIEIIVVNDGSTDAGKTRNIALSYGDKIKYIENKRNGGVSTALNAGIRHMKGEYFSWLSHDDIYCPTKIEKEIACLKDKPNMAVYSGWSRLKMQDMTLHTDNGRERYSIPYFTNGLFATTLGLIYGCTLLIPGEFFKKYGLFDEQLRAVQDGKKWFEMFHDKNLSYIDDNLVKVRVHKNQVTNTYKNFQNEADELYLSMMQRISKHCIHAAGMDVYGFYSAMITRMSRNNFVKTKSFLIKSLKSLPETADASISRCHFKKWLSTFGGENVYVYCIGNHGRALVEALKLRGISIDGISDSDERKWGMKIAGFICSPPKDIPKDALIIVSKQEPDSLRSSLCANGFKHVITFDMIEEYMFKVPIDKHFIFQYAEK